MSLSDPAYFGFLFLAFLVFYALPGGGARRLFLLGASWFFYFQLSHYLALVLLFVITAAWGGAQLLRWKAASARESLFFWLIAGVTLLPMLLFKYLGPILDATRIAPGWLAALALPVGVSFYTFAALGYVIDVYLGVIDPEPRFDRVALFVSFFPVVTAGPIERAESFFKQIEFDAPFSAEIALAGWRLILTGAFMKVVLAGALADPIRDVYSAPGHYTSLDHLCAAVFYSFYLYADFAGYSLIAIGSAKLFGIDVRPNFAQPFLSPTIPAYWRSWHISLSSWVRDYLFNPMRMEWRRRGNVGLGVALFLSFVILGAWHGAKWGYLLFGAIHGVLATVSTFTLAKRDAFWKRAGMPPALLYTLRVIVTFLLVTLALVVYRADHLADAFYILGSIFSWEGWSKAIGHPPPGGEFQIAGDWGRWAAIGTLIAGDILVRRKFRLQDLPGVIQGLAYNAAVFSLIWQFAAGKGNEPFVYYKF